MQVYRGNLNDPRTELDAGALIIDQRAAIAAIIRPGAMVPGLFIVRVE
jgi:hypothetical protein